MASISHDKANGTFRILFADGYGKRPTVYLGKTTRKDAQAVKARVEAIVAARLAGTSIDSETAAWLGRIPDDTRAKLEKVGLVEPRKGRAATPTVAEYVAGYIAGRTDVKPNTVLNLRRTEALFVGFVGAEKRLDEFTKADARDWSLRLKEAGYANATIGRAIRTGKQFFTDAVDRELIGRNPFAGIKAPGQTNKARQFFVSQEVMRRVADASPDHAWRLVVALARLGGLRIPSELVGLTWADIIWQEGRFRVRSPKTERHEGRGERWVPLFPELRPYLVAAFEVAGAGATRVFPAVRAESNLGQQFRRTIERAGVRPWPKLFANLRSSRQSELVAEGYPETDVCAWLGNTREVAADHYLQPLSSSFERAAEFGASGDAQSNARTTRQATQPTADREGRPRTPSTQPPTDEEVSRLLSAVVSGRQPVRVLSGGIELPHDSRQKATLPFPGNARSDAVDVRALVAALKAMPEPDRLALASWLASQEEEQRRAA